MTSPARTQSSVHPSSVVEEGVDVRAGALVSPFCLIRKDVVIGDWSYICPYQEIKEHVPPFTIINNYGDAKCNTYPVRHIFNKETQQAIKDAWRALTRGEEVPSEIVELEPVKLLLNFFEEYCE